jgi:hypothetical protein
VLVVYVVLFFVLAALLLLIDRVAAMSPHVKAVVQVALLVGWLVLAFQGGFWQGTVLLIAPVVAVELGRLIHKRVKAGA